MTLAQYLKKQSKQICKDNGCTQDEHKCETYAYITKRMELLDICMSDYFQGSSETVAAIGLPWSGSMKDLKREVSEQTWDA